MASRILSLVGLGATASLLGACIFVGSGGSKEHQQGTGGTTTTSTTTTTTTGSTTTTTSSQGGGGGGGSCVPGTGSGETDAVCDTLNITPEFHGGAAFMCGPNFDQDPLGHASCHRSFAIYKPGQAEDFAACLGLIGVQDTCDDSLVQACVSQTYNDACPDASVDDACQSIGDACASDPFDVTACSWALKVFSTSGVNEVIDCINATDPLVACQPAFDACFETVTAVGG